MQDQTQNAACRTQKGMTANQNRVPQGVSAGGQFAATAHAEPHLTLVAPIPEPTPEQTAAAIHAEVEANRPHPSVLRRHKSPVIDFLRRKPGTRRRSNDTTEVDDQIRSIQQRLQGKA